MLYPLNRIALAGITPDEVVANATGFNVQNVTRVESDQYAFGFQERMSFWDNRAFLVALHLGRMKDEGTLRPEHVSLGKMGNVRGAIEVARTARTILGANGVTLEYPVIRHVNNLESVLTYEGTHEVHTLVVGQALTGTNAFR